MAAIIVGQVAIKVRPDTKGFHGETKREIERHPFKDIEIGLEVKNVNDLQARSALERLEQAASNLGHEMDRTFRDRVLNAWIDIDGAEDVAKVRAMLDTLKDDIKANVEIDVKSDEWKDFIRALNEAKNGVQDLSVRFNVDDSSFDELTNAYRELEGMRDRLSREINFEVRVDPENLESVETAMANVLDKLHDTAEVEVKLRTDKDAIDQALAGIGEGLAEWARIHAVPVRFDADEDSLKEMQTILTAVKDASNITVKADVDLDELDRLETTLREGLDKLMQGEITIPAELDVNFVNALNEVRKAREAIEREMAETELQIALDRNFLWQSIEQGLNEAQRKAREAEIEVQARIDFNTASYARAMEIREKLADPIRFKIDADGVDKLIRELKDIKDFDGDEIKFNVDAETLVANARLALASRDRVVNFYVKVSEASLAKAKTALEALSGFRMLSSTLENIKQLFENLDKNIPLVGTIAEAVMGLSAWLLAAASNAFALSMDLARIGGAALTLPGILGGLATAIGITFAALKDFNGVVPEVTTELGRMQDAISNNFWAAFETPLRRLTESLLPAFGHEAAGTASYLGRAFASLADELTKALDPDTLAKLFGDLNESIIIGAQGAADFANIIALLGTTGSEYLPRMATWFNDILSRFNAWLTRNKESGKLFDWVEGGLDALHELGQVIKNTGRIFVAMADAASEAGGSKLHMVADTLDRVATAMERVSWQEKMVSVLKAAHEAMHVIATTSGPSVKQLFSDLARDFENIMRSVAPAIGELVKGVAQAISAALDSGGVLRMFDGIRAGIASLAPMWVPLGDAIGSVASIIGLMAESFGPLLAELLTQLAGFAKAAEGDITRLVHGGADLLMVMLKTLGPLVTWLVDALLSLVGVLGNNAFGFALIVGGLGALFLALKAGAIVKGLGDVATAIRLLRDVASGSAIQRGIQGIASSLANAGFETAASKVGNLAGKIGGFAAKAGPWALGIGAVVAACVALGTWAGTSGVQAPKVNDLATAIQRLGAKDTIANVKKLNSLFGGADNNGFAKFITSEYRTGVDKGADAIRNLGDAVSVVIGHAESSGWDKLLGTGQANAGTWGHSAAFNQGKADLEAFDAAMADILASGNQDAIAVGERLIAEAVAQTGRTRQEILAEMPEYSDGLEAQAVAAEMAAKMEVEARQKAENAWIGYGHVFSSEARNNAGVIAAIRDNYDGFSEGASKALEKVKEAAATHLGGATAETKANLREMTLAWLNEIAVMATAQDEWADNIATISQKMGNDVAIYFANLGPDAAAGVAAMLETLSDDELQQWGEKIRPAIDDVVGKVGGAYQRMVDESASGWNTLNADQRAAFEQLGIDAAVDLATFTEIITGALTSSDPEVRAAAETIVTGVSETLEGGKAPVETSSGILADGAVAGLGPMVEGFGEAANGSVETFMAKIVSGQPTAESESDEVARRAVAGLGPVVPGFGTAATSAVETFMANIAGGKPPAESESGAVARSAIAGLSPLKPEFQQKARESTSAFVDILTGTKFASTQAGNTIAASAVAGSGVLLPGMKTLGADGGSLFSSALAGTAKDSAKAGSTVANAAPNAIQAQSHNLLHSQGFTAGSSYVRGLQDTAYLVRSAMNGIANNTTVPNAGNLLYSAGAAAGIGFANGINAQIGWVRNAATNLANAANRAVRVALSIHSPSRVMHELGSFTGVGFAEGIEDETSTVRKAATSIAQEFNDALSETLEPVFDAEVVGSLSGKSAAATEAARNTGAISNRTLNYYAAEGSSLSSEEDLFAAAERGRLVWGY